MRTNKFLKNKDFWFYLLVSMVFVVVYFYLLQSVPITMTNDSHDYQRVAKQSFFSWDFWGTTRPPTIPLLLKFFGGNVSIFNSFQIFSSVFAWFLFSFAFLRELQTKWLKRAGFCTFLIVALSKDLFFWPKAVLSESLSNSFFLVLIACGIFGIRFLRKKKLRVGFAQQIFGAAAFFLLAAFWSCMRDVNSYFILGIAGIGVAAFVLFWKRLKPLLPTLLFFVPASLLLFAFQDHSAKLGGIQRWQCPMVNVIGQRILTNPEKTQFFVEHGMPLNQKVLCFKNRWCSSCGKDWSGFQGWIAERSKPTYIRFLLSRPIEHILEPLVRWQDVFSTSVFGYSGVAKPKVWQQALGYVFYPKGIRLVLLAFLSLALTLRCLALRKLDWRWIVPIVLFLLIYPMWFLNWHGDAMEVVRHVLGLNLHVKVTLWMLFILALDQVRFSEVLR